MNRFAKRFNQINFVVFATEYEAHFASRNWSVEFDESCVFSETFFCQIWQKCVALAKCPNLFTAKTYSSWVNEKLSFSLHTPC